MTKSVIVLEHEPVELDELAEAGADMQLCGHTHDGQLWPGTITINFFWENPCGYLKKISPLLLLPACPYLCIT